MSEDPDHERTRDGIRDLLALLSDPQAQRDYAQKVPIANVPAGLLGMWSDDQYHPSDAAFRAAFSPDELRALALFNQCCETAAAALQPEPGSIADLHAHPDWARLLGAAGTALRSIARSGESSSALTCRCVTVADLDIIDMGEHDDFFATLGERKRRGKPWWWLHLEVCRVCGQGWLVAQEERQNDIFCLRRLDEQTVARVIEESVWPSDFDRYETVLRMGRDAGRSVRFLDPVGDSSLKWTITDLARERPGIRISELCDLLNIDRRTAETIARRVVGETGAEIRFE